KDHAPSADPTHNRESGPQMLSYVVGNPWRLTLLKQVTHPPAVVRPPSRASVVATSTVITVIHARVETRPPQSEGLNFNSTIVGTSERTNGREILMSLDCMTGRQPD